MIVSAVFCPYWGLGKVLSRGVSRTFLGSGAFKRWEKARTGCDFLTERLAFAYSFAAALHECFWASFSIFIEHCII